MTAADSSSDALELSVIIPAFNEEALLGDTLASVAGALAGCGVDGRAEVIVVDNNSSDGTAEIARSMGARVIFEPENQISRARNAGGRAARGRFLVFLDADTRLTAALLEQALGNLRSGACCGGGVVLRMEHAVPPAMLRVLAFWNGLSVKLGLAAGCFVYCLREGFAAVGGFSQNVYAGEEIWFSRALKRWGRRRGLRFRVITEVRIATSGRKVEWFSPGQLALQTAVLVLFPWAARSRRLCRIWYWRPQHPEAPGRVADPNG